MKNVVALVMTAVLSLLALAVPPSGAAKAASFAVAPDSDLRLTVRLPEGNPYDDDKRPPLDGYTITLSKVEGIDTTTEAGYRLAKRLRSEDVGRDDVVQLLSRVTGADGTVTFTGFDAALYMVEARAPEGRTGSVEFDPVLVIAPGLYDDGTWATGITLTLKRTSPGEPTPPPEIPNPSPTPSVPPVPPAVPEKPGLPLTGASVVGLVVLAGVFLLGGAALRFRRESERQ